MRLAFISKQFVRYGLTSVHHEGGDLLALQEVRARGDLRHRVSYEPMDDVLEGMIAHGIATGFGDEWIRLGATSEHTCDGSFSERTMAMSTPYEGIEPAYYGNIIITQADLDAWVERVHRAGIQVNCHANGDVTIDMVLTALERAQRLDPRPDARPKITHCTLINDDLLRRIKAVGAVPAPFTSYAYYNSDKFHFYGEERMKRCMAFRSFADAGIPAAAGSDFSPGPFAPLMGIQGMVTRTGWDGRDLGRRAANHRRRGAAGHDDQRRLCLARRGDQGLDHAGQARRLRGARRRSPHRAAGQDQGHHDRRDGGRRKHGVPSVGARPRLIAIGQSPTLPIARHRQSPRSAIAEGLSRSRSSARHVRAQRSGDDNCQERPDKKDVRDVRGFRGSFEGKHFRILPPSSSNSYTARRARRPLPKLPAMRHKARAGALPVRLRSVNAEQRLLVHEGEWNMGHTIHNVGAAKHIGQYSDAVETESGLRWLFTSGTPGVADDGTIPPGIEAQSRLAWKYIVAALEKAGMTTGDLVKVTTSLTNAADIPAYAKVRGEFLGNVRPAFMLQIVTQLIKPEVLVEVEIIAARK